MSTSPRKKPSGAVQRPGVHVARRPAEALDVPAASDLPATCAMLAAVRTELLERIDQSAHQLRAEMQTMGGELRAEMHAMKGELKAEINEIKVGLHNVEAELRGVKAEVSRAVFLIEEQNARNKIVLDALVSVIDRQDRVEKRMDVVEATVRDLAAARNP